MPAVYHRVGFRVIPLYIENPMIDNLGQVEAEKDDNPEPKIIEATKEYFDEHPEEMDKLVLCYRDVFGHKGIKKENADIVEWGEYLRCKDCNKGLSIEEVFLGEKI